MEEKTSKEIETTEGNMRDEEGKRIKIIYFLPNLSKRKNNRRLYLR